MATRKEITSLIQSISPNVKITLNETQSTNSSALVQCPDENTASQILSSLNNTKFLGRYLEAAPLADLAALNFNTFEMVDPENEEIRVETNPFFRSRYLIIHDSDIESIPKSDAWLLHYRKMKNMFFKIEKQLADDEPLKTASNDIPEEPNVDHWVLMKELISLTDHRVPDVFQKPYQEPSGDPFGNYTSNRELKEFLKLDEDQTTDMVMKFSDMFKERYPYKTKTIFRNIVKHNSLLYAQAVLSMFKADKGLVMVDGFVPLCPNSTVLKYATIGEAVFAANLISTQLHKYIGYDTSDNDVPLEDLVDNGEARMELEAAENLARQEKLRADDARWHKAIDEVKAQMSPTELAIWEDINEKAAGKEVEALYEPDGSVKEMIEEIVNDEEEEKAEWERILFSKEDEKLGDFTPEMVEVRFFHPKSGEEYYQSGEKVSKKLLYNAVPTKKGIGIDLMIQAGFANQTKNRKFDELME